ncbi:Hypothetical protein DHA2_10034 [Giardia duodenalis]|uniref:Uncharacterized protein n=1 Tax=Giardia intestinalis TaxID=5741 RepID=V6THB3_GIAIN|nr:Hypothetical protein DHA2_10034 [Giardia intestinalis]
MEEGTRHTIPLQDIVREALAEQVESFTPIKPPPPHFLNEIAAGRNRQAARSQMLEAARKRVSERKDSKRSHTANMDYFTGDTINLRHLREEKRRAALIVDRANYLEHVEDTRKPLQLSKKEIEFHSYLSGNIYSQTIVLTNPGPTSRRYNILPPDAPFTCATLAGELKPGLSKTIEVLFRPESCADAQGVLTVRAKNFQAVVPIRAANEKANFVFLDCCLDNNESSDISNIKVEEVTPSDSRKYNKVFNVDLGPMMCRHAQKHNLSLILQHKATMPWQEYVQTHRLPIQSQYAEQPQEVPILHSIHVTSVSVENSSGECKMDLYLNKESCEGCYFPLDPPLSGMRTKLGKDRHARLETAMALAESVGLLDPAGVGIHLRTSFRKDASLNADGPVAAGSLSSSARDRPEYLCRMEPDGILSLELEFGDNIQATDTHIVSILTAERSFLEIRLQGYISSGFVEISSVGSTPLSTKPRSLINISQFLDGNYTLLPDQLLNIKTSLYTDEVQRLPIYINISSLPDKLLHVSLLEYTHELARGIVPANRFLENPRAAYPCEYIDAVRPTSTSSSSQLGIFSIQDIKTLADIPTEDNGQIDSYMKILNLYLHFSENITTPQRCILELSYYLPGVYAPILRILFTAVPIRRNPASVNMLETALAEQLLINSLTELRSEKRTDYIFISKPSIDFGLVAVSETARFCFSVRNCSKTVFFPFIVSINLKSHAVSITAGQTPGGINFVLHDNTIEGKSRKISETVEFPDVVEMLDNAKRTSAIEKLKPVITTAGMELKGDDEACKEDVSQLKQALPGNVNEFLKHNKVFVPTNVPTIRTTQGNAKALKELKISKHLANSCLGTSTGSGLSVSGKASITFGITHSNDAEHTSSVPELETLKSRMLKNKGNITGLNDVLSVYPSCGILPPRTQVQINVELCPLSIGPIEAFLVINTPSSQYYANVIRRIQAHLKEQEMRMSTYQSGLNKTALDRIYKERCLVTVPELELIRYQEKLNNTRLYSASDKPIDGILGHTRSTASLTHVRSKKSLKSLTDTSSLDDEQPLWLGNANTNLSDDTRDEFLTETPEGIMSNDRDVCCRVFGVVAAPSVAFLEEFIEPTMDSVKSVTIHLKNTGLTEITVNLTVLKGDAMLIQPITDEQRAILTPNSLMALVNSTLLRKDITLTLGVNETIPVDVMPGAEHDSYVVARKELSSFGALAYKISKDQLDLSDNVMLSAVLIKARVESPRPYIYLANDPQNKYIISDPKIPLTPEIFLDTKPYKPVVVEFVIANPSGNPFTAELTTGPDLVAPSTIKIPPKSKTFAAFAILPDRSGQMTTFINFHDCPVRITLNAIGPDIVISSPYIKNSNLLVDHQGMADDVLPITGPLDLSKDMSVSHRKPKKSSKWDEILAILPNRIIHVPLTYTELTNIISDYVDTRSVDNEGDDPGDPNEDATQSQMEVLDTHLAGGVKLPNSQQEAFAPVNRDANPIYRMTIEDTGKVVHPLQNYLDILDSKKYGTVISQTATFNRRENNKKPLDFSRMLTSRERFLEIRQYLPSISFSKTVGETASRVCINVFNPTVTDMDVDINVYDIPNSFIGLRAARDTSGHIYLHPSGPFVSESVEHKPDFGRLGPEFDMTVLHSDQNSESTTINTPSTPAVDSTTGHHFAAQLLQRNDDKGKGINKYFKASPEHVVVGSQKSAKVYIETMNFDAFREFEGLLNIKGLFLLLKCQRVQPQISLSDGIELINIAGSYERDTDLLLNISNPTDDCMYTLLLDVPPPFELLQKELAVTPTLLRPHGLLSFKLILPAVNCLKMAKNQWVGKVPRSLEAATTILDLLKQERTKFLFDSTLTVIFPECRDTENTPYNIVFPIACRIDAPAITPEFSNVTFQPAFVGEYSTKYIKIENPTHLSASWEMLHVPLGDAQKVANLAIRKLPPMHHLENLRELKEKYLVNELNDIKAILQAVNSTFTEKAYGSLFYDGLTNTIMVDDPSVFTFDCFNGVIEGHNNTHPYKNFTITARFTPADNTKNCALCATKDGEKKIKFFSVFYIRVYGGAGAWIFMTGEVTEDIFQI